MTVWLALVGVIPASSPVSGPERPPQAIVIQAGRPVEGDPAGSSPVMAVADTTLIGTESNRNLGGSELLSFGPNRAVLIRFDDLRALKNRRITSARLIFRVVAGTASSGLTVGRLLRPWGEGPLTTFARLRGAPTEAPPPLRSATWRANLAGISDWQRPGASGPEDSVRVESAAATTDGSDLVITGLESSLQEMARNPDLNFGFVIRLADQLEVNSSQNGTFPPRLEITSEPNPPAPSPLEISRWARERDGSSWRVTANLRNVSGATVPAFSTQWITDGRAGVESADQRAFAPGEERAIVTTVPVAEDGRAGESILAVRIGGDIATSATVFPNGREIPVTPTDTPRLADFNRLVAPYSRYSFAPEGTSVRLFPRQEDTAPPLIDSLRTTLAIPNWTNPAGLERIAGYFGYGDSRGEALVPGSIGLPLLPVRSAIFDNKPLVASRLLSISDVYFLNQPAEAPIAPAAVLARVQDLGGRPQPGTNVTIRAGNQAESDPPLFQATVPGSGTVILPKPNGVYFPRTAAGPASTWIVTASRNGTVSRVTLAAWELTNLIARSGPNAGFLDWRFNLANAPVERSSDLATGKLLTDSAGTPPATLLGLFRGNPITLAKAGDWLELDLGRDRSLAEIGLDGDLSQFRIIVYGTGQRPDEGAVFADEIDFNWTKSLYGERNGDRARMPYRGPITKARYVRIINNGNAGRLTKLDVFAANLAAP